MTLHFTKRGFVRIISFVLAALLIAGGFAFLYAKDAQQSRSALKYHYQKGISDLSVHLQNIDGDLTKVLYTNSPELLSTLSSKLWRESGFAKDLITSLPVEYLKLQSTNKFLSQVGDYCQSLAKSASADKPMTKEQRELIAKLNEYSNQMLSELIAINDAVQTGSIKLDGINSRSLSTELDKEPKADGLTEGFASFEEGFTSYPTLIYDGPFSDHIMEKEPLRLKNEGNVAKADARRYAADLLGISPNEISESTDEESKMPSYGFKVGKTDISITKQGGLLSYLLTERSVYEEKLSPEEAKGKAEAFLKRLIDLGTDMTLQSTYYEISSNVITFNYACVQDDVLIYPDLIKIGVAMDNGEILSFDARGYIVNHTQREIHAPLLSKAQAQKLVSPSLAVKDYKLCIIPSDGLNEVYCYEFLCKAEDGKTVLVYINADTGKEERLLILLSDQNGQLTV